ncbi:hypothetical protein [Candidatus Fokinia solitaria]|uniref:hypothetical protein n=1 Tax=Candidatus Fokinia solitaria TaxID=1802984 RepID=UPI000D3ECA32|nr:hypothetical protein [Candidatus Fokinia solitaria]
MNQVAIFYESLNVILSENGLADCELRIKEGSLITKITAFLTEFLRTKANDIAFDMICDWFIKPSTTTSKLAIIAFLHVSSATLRYFTVRVGENSKVIYDKSNIKQRRKELQASYEQDKKREKSEEKVQSLQMQFMSRHESIKRMTHAEKDAIEKKEVKFTAKFDDPRYEGIKYEIQVIIPVELWDDVKIEKGKYYSFTAHGILYRGRKRYEKLKVEEIVNKVSIRKEKNLSLNY